METLFRFELEKPIDKDLQIEEMEIEQQQQQEEEKEFQDLEEFEDLSNQFNQM